MGAHTIPFARLLSTLLRYIELILIARRALHHTIKALMLITLSAIGIKYILFYAVGDGLRFTFCAGNRIGRTVYRNQL